MNAAARSLDDWLQHIGSVHPVGIDMGLGRIRSVAERLGFGAPGHRPAPRNVIVAGTNGKGSTCVAMEALLRAAGLRVGTTLSPHVHRFNERIRIDGEALEDDGICAAFAAVEAARGEVTLTYFEFAALAALQSFREAAVDVAVLEVGLGGRLDAFNLVDADVAVITSIGLDHQAYLGDDLETIGREKAGVLREGRPAVLGAPVTASVTAAAQALGCPVSRLGCEIEICEHPGGWDFSGSRRQVRNLPLGDLAAENCALAIEAVDLLVAERLPDAALGDALAAASLPGRLEPWQLEGTGGRLLLLDVAHNPAGAAFLAAQLERRYPGRRFVGLLGVLADKDAAGMVTALVGRVRAWVCAPTRGARGRPADSLAALLAAAAAGDVVPAADVKTALAQAISRCGPDDGILAFGSFDLVEQLRDALQAGAGAGSPPPMEARR